MSNNITRKELVGLIFDEIGSESKVNHVQIDACISSFLSHIKTSLANKKTIELRGFGTFELKKRAAKNNSRNPKTGQLFSTREHYTTVFKSGGELNKMIRELE